MNVLKPCLAAMVLVAGLSGASRAQGVGTGSRTGTGGSAAFPVAGTNLNYYSLKSGFGNYGLSGTHPAYGGFNPSGYRPGSNVGGIYTATLNSKGGRVYSNMGGSTNSIQKQPIKPGDYRNRPKDKLDRTGRGR